MKKKLFFFFLISSFYCYSQPFYKLELQLFDKNLELPKDTILCICKNGLGLWGSEVVTGKGLYIIPLDVSLCDSAYLSFVSYTNPNHNDRLYLQEIGIVSEGYKLGDYIVKIRSYKVISKNRYEKMMKRQHKRFFLNGWFQRDPSKEIDSR